MGYNGSGELCVVFNCYNTGTINGNADSGGVVVRHSLGIFSLSPEILEYADIDNDGSINVPDALLLLRVSLGLAFLP